MIVVFWLITWLIQNYWQSSAVTCMPHTIQSNLFLVESDHVSGLSQSFTLFWQMWNSPKPLHYLWLGITAILAKYPGFIYGCIFLVPSSLILWPMGSKLSEIAKGHHEYHTEYCWPNFFLWWYRIFFIKSATSSLLGMCPTRDSPIAKANWVAFLFQNWFLLGCIMYNWNIVPINIWRIRYRNTHHHQLVSQASQCIYTLFHGDKLSTKNWCPYCRLLLSEPLH